MGFSDARGLTSILNEAAQTGQDLGNYDHLIISKQTKHFNFFLNEIYRK